MEEPVRSVACPNTEMRSALDKAATEVESKNGRKAETSSIVKVRVAQWFQQESLTMVSDREYGIVCDSDAR